MTAELRNILLTQLGTLEQTAYPGQSACPGQPGRTSGKVFTDEDAVSKLCAYYDQLTLFNGALGLVSAQEDEIITRHIIDSLRPLPLIEACLKSRKTASGPVCSEAVPVTVADLGSGNGLPGLVLACVRDDWDFTLIERMGRRAGFLRYATAVTGNASHVKVEESNIEDVDRTFDVILMRAFRPFDAVEKTVLKLCNEGSCVFVWTAGAKYGVRALTKENGAFEELPAGDIFQPGVLSPGVSAGVF